MNIAFMDAESASRISISACGSHRYARDGSTRPILWGVLGLSWSRALCFEDENPFDVLLRLREAKRLKWGKKKNPLIVMHWTPFDQLLAREYAPDEWIDDGSTYGIRGPHNTIWVDLAELALTAGLPGNLEGAADFCGTELKGAGKKLIELFCTPPFASPEAHPVQWEEFKVYCAQDVQAMRPVWHALEAAGVSMDEHIETSWAVRQMNERGVRADVYAASYLLSRLEDAQEAAEQEVYDRYGFKTAQVAQMRDFLGLHNCKADTIEAAVEAKVLDEDQLFVAETRLGLAGAARKKLRPLVNFADPDDHRIRGGFIYHGAWTGRLTSLGVQFQNMVRHKSDPAFFANVESYASADLFAETRKNIRGFLLAKPKHTLIGVDYKAIELRVGAWLAGEGWLVELLANGGDAYRRQAAEQFGCREDEVTDDERQYGKAVELAAMYGQGGGGFQRRRRQEGEELPLARCELSISIFRRSHPAFVTAWKECGDAFRRAIKSPAGRVIEALGGKLQFERFEHSITLVRPSGATQVFWMPTLVDGEWPDGSPREEIAFIGKSAQIGRMVVSRTYGANIFQNAVQGIALDLMLEALVRIEREKLDPVLSVHDEIAVEARKEEAQVALARVEHLMMAGEGWTIGIPVDVESWVSERYTK